LGNAKEKQSQVWRITTIGRVIIAEVVVSGWVWK
jgi:type IV secretory pathway TrbF-like protein